MDNFTSNISLHNLNSKILADDVVAFKNMFVCSYRYATNPNISAIKFVQVHAGKFFLLQNSIFCVFLMQISALLEKKIKSPYLPTYHKIFMAM
jgi:hypothetical protein